MRCMGLCVKKTPARDEASAVGEVPKTGLEPAQPCGYQSLKLARLPIPPFGLNAVRRYV